MENKFKTFKDILADMKNHTIVCLQGSVDGQPHRFETFGGVSVEKDGQNTFFAFMMPLDDNYVTKPGKLCFFRLQEEEDSLTLHALTSAELRTDGSKIWLRYMRKMMTFLFGNADENAA